MGTLWRTYIHDAFILNEKHFIQQYLMDDANKLACAVTKFSIMAQSGSPFGIIVVLERLIVPDHVVSRIDQSITQGF